MSIGWNAATTSCCNIAFSTLSTSTSAVVGTLVNSMTTWGTETQTGSDSASYKPVGLLSVSGTLYAFTTRQNPTRNAGDSFKNTQANAQIIKSTDHGVTWTPAPPSTAAPYASPQFPSGSYGNFGSPFFVQYGQDYAGNTVDNAGTYVYAISNDGFWNNGSSRSIIGRVPISAIGNLSASDWTFFTGGDGSNSANWSATASSATSILTNSGELSQASVQYIPSLGRYLMIAWYYPSIPVVRW